MPYEKQPETFGGHERHPGGDAAQDMGTPGESGGAPASPAPPDLAEKLYQYIIQKCRACVADVKTGEFGAYMQVSLTNDGPFTILLDSDELVKKKT